jgi:hypothetical protein
MCGGSCDDPFVTYLNSIGYNAIRLPRAHFRPLQIMSKEGNALTWLGDVSDVFIPEPQTRLPNLEADIAAGEFSGKRSGQLSVGLGISLLGSIIGALGGSKLGLEVAYKRAKYITFEFSDVLIDRVAPAQLDQFLGGSDVNPSSVAIGKMLDADQVYVITSIVKSRKFTVEATTSDGTSLNMEVPEIQNIVKGNVKVATEGATATKISYQGNIALAFGFQAVQLYYDKGAYTAFKPLDAGVAARAFGETREEGTELLNMGGALVRLQAE